MSDIISAAKQMLEASINFVWKLNNGRKPQPHGQSTPEELVEWLSGRADPRSYKPTPGRVRGIALVDGVKTLYCFALPNQSDCITKSGFASFNQDYAMKYEDTGDGGYTVTPAPTATTRVKDVLNTLPYDTENDGLVREQVERVALYLGGR